MYMMNLPLNIDFQQILLHLLNFAILAVGLFFLLFRPVKRFMAERQQYFADLEKQAQERTQRAKELEAEYQARLDTADAVVREKEEAGAARVAAAADMIRGEAKIEAQRIVEKARQEGEAEKARIIEEAGTQLASMVVSATEKLMAHEPDPETEEALYQEFLASAEKGTTHEGNP